MIQKSPKFYSENMANITTFLNTEKHSKRYNRSAEGYSSIQVTALL